MTRPHGLTHCGLPLGGLGTGSVELRADGLFHAWQIANNHPWGTGPALPHLPDGGFFALHCRSGSSRFTAPLVQRPGFHPFLNDPYHFPWMAFPLAIRPRARFPFTRLTYRFAPACPVDLVLEAFSPFIPHQPRDSALPGAFFHFELRNRTTRPITVTLAQAQRNLAGYTHPKDFSRMRVDAPHRIEFSRDGAQPDGSADGTLALASWASVPHRTTHLFHPRGGRDFWDALRDGDALDNLDIGDYTGPRGNAGQWQDEAYLRSGLPYGFLANTIELPPRARARVTFTLAWHFPHFWQAAYPERGVPARRSGHRYNLWFASAAAVAAHLQQEHHRLHAQTRAFARTLDRSSLAPWQIDALTAPLTVLIKSSWWDELDRFGIWEGLGCCGLQTVDVAHYACHPLALWFPQLQHRQMDLSIANMEKPGQVPHLMPATFECANVDHHHRIDLPYNFINILWRDILWSGARERARALLPLLTPILRRARAADTDSDGLPNNQGPDQTYDQFPLLGTSSLVGFQAAAAFFSASEMAAACGDSARATAWRQQAESALTTCQRQLWTGSGYRLSFDSTSGTANEGVMVDQLNGDWTRRMIHGRPLIPIARARTAARTILRRCLRPQDGFLANCWWPPGQGIRTGRHTSDQPNLPWSGVEYAFASYCLLLGLEDEAWRLVRMVWDRYEAAGLRFNHIECGEHYYRAMSSWTVYLAWSGFRWDGLSGLATFTPPRTPTKRFLASTPTSWGLAQWSRQSRTLRFTWHPVAGSLTMHSLLFPGLRRAPSSLLLNKTAPPFKTTPSPEGLLLHFTSPQEISSARPLRITFPHS